MAERVELFETAIAAATAIAAPTTFVLSMNPGVTRKVEIIVPPGPSGLVGFRLRHSGQTVIPYAGSNWVITDDEKLEWALEGYPTGDRWTLQAYNTDIYQHTLYIRWFLDEIPDRVAGALVPIAIE